MAGKVRKQLHIPVIASSDTQWRGGMQWFNVLVSRFRHRRWFSHLFVSGEPQVAYARKLGFRQEQILMHNLSADVELFHNVDLKMREKEYPRRLVFIGRFSKEKGLAYLLEAWNTIPDRKNWKLVLIGNGPDYPKLKGYLRDLSNRQSKSNQVPTFLPSGINGRDPKTKNGCNT